MVNISSYILLWLVVWNMNFMTFHSVGNFIIPTDELIVDLPMKFMVIFHS